MDGNNNNETDKSIEDDNVRKQSESISSDPSLAAKEHLENFFDSRKDDVDMLSRSIYATYKKNPEKWFQRLTNVINVAFQEKMKDCHHGGTKSNCIVSTKYKDLVSRNLPMDEIGQLFDKAKDNSNKQTITNYFKSARKEQPEEVDVAVAGSSGNTKQQESSASASNDNEVNFQLPTTKQKEIFKVFSVSPKDSLNIETSLKIDQDIIASEKPVALVKQFLALHENVEKKKYYERPKSKFYDEKAQIFNAINDIKKSFERLSYLTDKEKRIEDSMKLKFDEIPAFFAKNRDEVQSLGKSIFLQLNSSSFSKQLKSVIHKLQKRLSNLHKTETPDGNLRVSCYKAGFSWTECMEKIDRDGWIPDVKRANLRFEDLEKCRDVFRSMEYDDQEFITGDGLLNWLNKTERKIQALDTLVENLPIVKFVKRGKIVLCAVETFLHSRSMVEDFFDAVIEEENKVPDVEVRKGTVPNLPRKQGSGRPRIVEQNPDILETTRAFAESAGISAHNRRREGVGRFGFTIEDCQKVIRDKLFSNNPELCPSLTTIRRMFEAPSLARKTKSFYKGDIECRPGTKRNDDPYDGEVHPHRHECSAFVKITK